MTLVYLITAGIAFILTASLGIFFIPFLKKLKYGQTINEIGPTWHIYKQGIPTMGGIMFIIGIVTAAVFGFVFVARDGLLIGKDSFVAGIGMALGFALIGFFDDYIKVVKKRNLGLTEKQKLIMQFIVTVFYLVMLNLSRTGLTILHIPFFGSIELGFLYYPLAAVVIVGLVNAVNLTDGVDGLASSITFVVCAVFMMISLYSRNDYMAVLSVAAVGGCIGFLVWNFHPAKVFMGDTGSMFLGGLVIALGFGLKLEILTLILGIIYLAEAGSVILQIISVKLRRKKLFKMSPIHHHFEMSGWSENKIVTVFSAVTIVSGAVVYLIYLFD